MPKQVLTRSARCFAAVSAVVVAVIAAAVAITVWRYENALNRADVALDARYDARQTAELNAIFWSPSATVDFRPTRFVTIDDQMERKLLAIQAFASQTQIRAYLEPDLIQSTARYWSRYGDGRYAEAFEVIREAATEGQPAGPAPGMAAPAPKGELADAPQPA
jgi:LmbE family N-acetylglucosaminyl deacetylase